MFQSFYVLENKILGRGLSGPVYLGKDVANDKYVALKHFPKNIKDNQKIINEISIPLEFEEENLVKMFGITEIDNKKYIVFEYCKGGDLSRYLRYFKRFEESEVQNFMRQILRGLNVLHSYNIIHHDIKPGNILVELIPFNINNKRNNEEKNKFNKILDEFLELTDNKKNIEEIKNSNINKDYIFQSLKHSILKLSDFGLSKFKECNNEKIRGGTELYMDPNLFRSDADVITIEDPKVDIWSVGIVAYELFFGKKPFDSKEALSKGIYNIDLKECKKISKPFLSFLNMCLQRKQNMRDNCQFLLDSEFITRDSYLFEYIDQNNLNEIEFPNKDYVKDNKIIMSIDDNRSINIKFDIGK